MAVLFYLRYYYWKALEYKNPSSGFSKEIFNNMRIVNDVEAPDDIMSVTSYRGVSFYYFCQKSKYNFVPEDLKKYNRRQVLHEAELQ